MAEIPDILERVAMKVGDYISGKISDRITAQDPSWPPLAASTIAKKGSTKAWIDQGEIRSIVANTTQSVKTEGTNPKILHVGIFDHEKAFIAYCLEFGTGGGSIVAGGIIHTWNRIPERPLFRLVFDEEQETVVEMIHEEIGKEVDRFLEKFFSQ